MCYPIKETEVFTLIDLHLHEEGLTDLQQYPLSLYFSNNVKDVFFSWKGVNRTPHPIPINEVNYVYVPLKRCNMHYL